MAPAWLAKSKARLSWLPPRIELFAPLAVLVPPPLTELEAPWATLAPPPLTEASIADAWVLGPAGSSGS